MIELLPCQFCGEIPTVFEEDGVIACGNRHCPTDEVRTPATSTHKEAIEAWNKRAEKTCTNFGNEEGTNGEGYEFACSLCGYKNSEGSDWDYCPNCGSRVIVKVHA